jgi:hybrid polyketide synthase/nonribosomal peptide synthetase ACE1
MSNGKLVLRLGQPTETALPDRPAQGFELRDIDVDDFYDSLSKLGYNYAGLLRGISTLKRTKDMSAGTIYIPDDSEKPCPYVIHPAALDVGFQGLFGSVGEPGDGRLWTLHVPTTIDRIKINPTACPPGGGLGVELPFNTGLATTQPQWTPGFTGDIAVYDESGTHCLVQCESLRISALAQPSKADDRHIFGETIWGGAEPNAEFGFEEWVETDLEIRLGPLVERACLFYLKQLHETITPEEREKCDEQRKRILDWAEHIVSQTSQGAHPILKKEWLNDTAKALKPQLHQ